MLTLRTQNVETHKGQISFPGGIMEPGDESLIDTAMRETREEIGLATDKVQLLGRFDEYPSITGLIVTPFVGWIEPPFDLNPNPNEVEEILYVPFDLFRDRTLLRVEMSKRFDEDYPIYYYNFQGRDVWGLTARIIRDFLILIDSKNEMRG